MWLKWFLLAAGCFPMLWSGELVGQTPTNKAGLAITNLFPGGGPQILRSNNGNIIIISKNASGSVTGRMFRIPQQSKDLKTTPGTPAPGVYKTEPYTCILVVPGGHPDDHSVIHAPEPSPNIPVLKPELRFVPLQPK